MTPTAKRLSLALGLVLTCVLSLGPKLLRWNARGRSWTPSRQIETTHYVIYSTATSEQTAEIGEVAETLYRAYIDVFHDAPNVRLDHPKLNFYYIH